VKAFYDFASVWITGGAKFFDNFVKRLWGTDSPSTPPSTPTPQPSTPTPQPTPMPTPTPQPGPVQSPPSHP